MGLTDPCTCGHALSLHKEEETYACTVCGDNTRCNYADPEEISADRWEEGWIAAVMALCPPKLSAGARILWTLERMPEGNPYR